MRRGNPVRLALIGILIAAFALRVFGLNWDDDQLLHPDEYHVADVTFSRITLPRPIDWDNLRDPKVSTLNPRSFNQDGKHQSFAYGALPLYVTDLTAEVLNQLRDKPVFSAVIAGPTDRDWHSIDQVWKVGRFLNMVLDTLVVLIVFLIARRVGGPVAGLAAAAIYAFSPIVIQLAHFYTTDTWLTFGCALTLLCGVRAAESGGRWAFAVAGAAAALTMATKPTGAVAVAIVGLALLYDAWLRYRSGYPTAFLLTNLAERFVLASLAFIVIFAVTEPYTVLDPSSYMADLREQSNIQRGTWDVPYTRVYVDTPPLVYQAGQLVRWGMGPVAGILGLVGCGFLAWRLYRHRGAAEFITLGWAGVFLMTLILPETKFLRYVAPLVPALAVAGGYLVSRVARVRLPRFSRTVGVATSAAALACILFWVTATTSIYAHTNTRVQASQWIYGNVPPGSSITTEVWDRGVPLDLGPVLTADQFQYQWDTFDSYTDRPAFRDFEALATALESQPLLRPVAESTQASNWREAQTRLDQVDGQVAQLPGKDRKDLGNTLIAAASGFGPTSGSLAGRVQDLGNALTGDDPTAIQPAAQELGDEIVASGSQEAGSALYDQISTADYYVISSNRITESVPRLPWRYPVQTAFFEELQQGDLGFHLVAEFEEHPTALGLSFNDDAADETWINYDHPRVLIFEKASQITRDQFLDMLAPARSQVVTPTRDAPSEQLLLDTPDGDLPVVADARWSAEITHVPGMAVLFWVVMLILLQVAGFPWARLLLGNLADGGWVFARLLITLIGAFIVWMGASMHLLEFRAVWCIATIVILGIVGWAVAWRWKGGRVLFRSRPGQRRVALVGELLFWAVFALFLIFRYVNPDSWHTVWGGEKPMEFAFINAILRSAEMPPYDPWYSGGYLNYYYYGMYIVAFLIKLTGIPSEIAFNIAQPTTFGLLGAGAYGVAATLGRDLTKRLVRNRPAAIVSGLIGAVLMLIVGNLVAFFSWLRGDINGSWDVVWNPSRALGNTTITEFPFFTGLYADLHAHVVALPITTLIIAMGYALASQPRVMRLAASTTGGVGVWRVAFIGRLMALALLLGTLYMSNAWDLPTYVLVAAGAVFLATRAFPTWASRIVATGVAGFALAVMMFVVILPFYLKYVTLFSSVGRVHTTDSLWLVLEHFGGLLSVVLVGLVTLLAVRARGAWRAWLQPMLPLIAILAFLGLGALLSTTVQSPNSRFDLPALDRLGLITVLALLLAAVAWSRSTTLGGDVNVATIRLLFVFAVVIVSIGAAVVGQPVFAVGAMVFGAGLFLYLFVPGTGPRYVGLMVAAAGGVLAALQVVFLADDLNGGDNYRMNTVFKFFNQVWVLLAISGGALAGFAAVRALGPGGEPARSPSMARADQSRRERLVAGERWASPTVAPMTAADDAAIQESDGMPPQIGPDNSGAADHPAVHIPRDAATSDIPGPVGPYAGPSATPNQPTAEMPYAYPLAVDAAENATPGEPAEGIRAPAEPPAPVSPKPRFIPVMAAPSRSVSGGPRIDPPDFSWSRVAVLITVVAILMGLVYPLTATPVRLANRFAGTPHTLNAYEWMNYASIGTEIGSCPDGVTGPDSMNFRDDLAAINWFNDQVHGSPVIAEASVGIYRCDGSRFSMSTGLPTIIGWDHHEAQQRNNPDLGRRVQDVHRLYSSTDPQTKMSILNQYGVQYVVVGTIERHLTESDGGPWADPRGLATFDQMVGTSLEVAYQHGETTVYRVLPPASGT